MVRRMLSFVLAVTVGVTVAVYTAQAQAPRSRLDVVKSRGKLICGVSGTTPGWSFTDPRTNQMRGFDADFCRGVAAFAGVGDVEFVNLTVASRWPAVLSGSVDVVFRTAAQSYGREQQVDFGPVTFYDGARLLVKSTSKIRGLDDLNGARICVHTGSIYERYVTDQMRRRGFKFELITFSETKEAFDTLVAGRCDVQMLGGAGLAGLRSTAPNPRDYTIVGKELDSEPLAPFYQQNDSRWAKVVNYTIWGVLLAEELGITQITTGSASRLKEIADKDPEAKLLLETNGGAMVRVLRAVGNYGEIYNRNWGPAQPTALPRQGTRNALWRDGGAMTSRSFR